MEIHHADQAYRKRSIWLLAGIVLMCGILLWELHGWLQGFTARLGSEDPDTVRHWLRVLLAGFAVGMAVMNHSTSRPSSAW